MDHETRRAVRKLQQLLRHTFGERAAKLGVRLYVNVGGEDVFVKTHLLGPPIFARRVRVFRLVMGRFNRLLEREMINQSILRDGWTLDDLRYEVAWLNVHLSYQENPQNDILPLPRRARAVVTNQHLDPAYVERLRSRIDEKGARAYVEGDFTQPKPE